MATIRYTVFMAGDLTGFDANVVAARMLRSFPSASVVNVEAVPASIRVTFVLSYASIAAADQDLIEFQTMTVEDVQSIFDEDPVISVTIESLESPVYALIFAAPPPSPPEPPPEFAAQAPPPPSPPRTRVDNTTPLVLGIAAIVAALAIGVSFIIFMWPSTRDDDAIAADIELISTK